ncbi:MAG: hypothetical protein FWG14_01630 [Peptococcaceae bacterium]|nr:hypothetical protein [Peptococcaceae bacterium]
MKFVSEETTLIISIIAALSFLGIIASFLLRKVLFGGRNQQTHFDGIKASAMIEEIKLGGRAVYNEFHPAVKLQVLVENEKGEPYSAQIETTIAITHIPKFQPGAKIDIVYDPADPSKVKLLSPTE